MTKELKTELTEERKKNREDIIRHAKWEAEMVKKLGPKWFQTRDKWLSETLETDKELWEKYPKIKKALTKTILTKDKKQQTHFEK